MWAALLGVKKTNHSNEQAAALSVAIDQRQRLFSASPTLNRGLGPQFLQGLSKQALSQIAVDLPRCHAYDPLMASPLGQEHLSTVLVASLLSNADKYEYTQVSNFVSLQ